MPTVLRLNLMVNKSVESELSERVKRLRPTEAPHLDPLPRAVQFLRGTASRAAFALPAFYLFFASTAEANPRSLIKGYPGVVLRHSIEFSSIANVALACRKVFDHKATNLTGANFAKCSDSTLNLVAEYWSKNADKPTDDALCALQFLRIMFQDCAKTSSALFESSSVLARRIGLLKQYADRTAAHLSLEPHEFTILDCAHVVAALTLMGEIILSFDSPERAPGYFNGIDEAGASAAKQLFPGMPEIRLFDDIDIAMQARSCWRIGPDFGRQMLHEQLPYAISWF